jgi:elongator complex protein 3
MMSEGVLAPQIGSPEQCEKGRRILAGAIDVGPDISVHQFGNIVRNIAQSDSVVWSKAFLLKVFERYYASEPELGWLRRMLTKRPIRSLSGITSITVLTKPFPCPGRCVFCPVDVRMPKSYIATEPGAQRAGRLGFDPYQQVTTRLRAYTETGHPTSKIELIVLGGSWSAYPREYQRWFIKRLFEALNDFGVKQDGADHSYPTDWQDRISSGETYNGHINASKYVTDAHIELASPEELIDAQNANENAQHRCVGLSLETRPDLIDAEECEHLRFLGATKIQIGIQSMDDRVLRLNKRGHKVAKAESAITLLRRFGFKVHAHWMPNLYGSTAAMDVADFDRLYDNNAIRPDELKVYPTVLIQDTELEKLAAVGKWLPYSEQDLTSVLSHVMETTPEYSRLTRIIRDIPSQEILAGNKKGNLRQIVEHSVDPMRMHDIRAREIRDELIAVDELVLEAASYDTRESREIFLQFVRPADRKLAAFTRLSLPSSTAPIVALKDAAIIREVHVYGPSIVVGDDSDQSQHQGLGRRLIAEAEARAKSAGFNRLAVISAIGTRPYYARLGFMTDGLYQVKAL